MFCIFWSRWAPTALNKASQIRALCSWATRGGRETGWTLPSLGFLSTLAWSCWKRWRMIVHNFIVIVFTHMFTWTVNSMWNFFGHCSQPAEAVNTATLPRTAPMLKSPQPGATPAQEDCMVFFPRLETSWQCHSGSKCKKCLKNTGKTGGLDFKCWFASWELKMSQWQLQNQARIWLHD